MKDKLIKIKELYSLGYTSTMVAEILDIDRKGLNYYIKKYNIPVLNKSRKYHVNDTYFDNIDTEAKAYLLGFFIADGYLTKEGRICWNNSTDDISVLQLFQKEVSPDSKIIISNRQTGALFRKPQCAIRIHSKHMTKILIDKYDIIPNKTKNTKFKFNFNNIPINLQVHFIRGFFDGDGSVSFYKYRNSIFFNFSFVFNSNNFTQQISEIFVNKFNIKSVIKELKGKTTNWFSLRFDYNRNRTEKIKEIYEYLYENATIYLDRKKVKFNNYLEYRANSTNNIVEQCNA